MNKCTVGQKHKWEFVKNVVVRTKTLRTIHLSNRGIYKCACGERKYGRAQFEEALPT